MAWLLPGARPTICNLAVTNWVCGSQLSVTVPDGSLPSGTTSCTGPAAALVVDSPEEVAPDDVELAPDDVADGAEFEPHPPRITVPTTAAIVHGNA